MQGNSVHIALYQDQEALLAFFRIIQRKQVFSLVKNKCFRRIQVFGRAGITIHDPPAKSNDISTHINNREHQPVAKTVKQIPIFPGNRNQAGVPKFLICIPLFLQQIRQFRPAVRRIANSEFRDYGFAHAPLRCIFQGLSSRRGIKLCVKKTGCLFMQSPQTFLLTISALILLILGNLNYCTLCQRPNRVAVAQSFNLHLKLNHATAFMTSKAVIDSLIRCDGKRSSLLSMEGTEAKQVGSGTLQSDILTNHIFNWIAGSQLV